MGKIIISENVSLDGVVQDPMDEEGTGRGNWFGQVADGDREAWAKVEFDEALATEALLLGRRTDAWFARRWLTRTGAWADRLNGMPKYVVSSTIDQPAWCNATVLAGDVPSEVSKLKEKLAGDIVVYGSIQLAHALIAHDLADEVRLTIYPVVVGVGERLFPPTSNAIPMRLVSARTLGDGLAYLVYERMAP
jgi:dihydrofolate reductase